MNPNDNRNLLAGLLALKMDFVGRNELLAAMKDWRANKARPLEEILRRRDAIDDGTGRLLAALVERHLELHQGNPANSLAAVASHGDELSQRLAGAGAALETTLSQLLADTDRTPPPPPGASQPPAVESGGRYRVLRPHAKGGLGKVSVALDEELNREVAFKEMNERFAHDLNGQARFLQEARITGALEHPGVVPVYGLGKDADGLPYYAMRFVRGETLKEAIDQFHRQSSEAPLHSTLELRKLLNRFVAVCDAVEYAHSRGILHRDLKPANVMLGQYGETLVVDWGLAKFVGREQPETRDEPSLLVPESGSAATRQGSAVGTPAYMSPEQAAGKVDSLTPASDVYSLGATLYHILTGQPPFAQVTGDVLKAVQQGGFPRPRHVLPSIPRALEDICLKAMTTAAKQRYPSPRALADDVEHYLADEPVSAHRDTLPERAGRWVRRHRAWALAGAAALALVAVVSTVAAGIVNHQKQQIAEARSVAEDRRVEAERARDRADRHVDHAHHVLGTLGELALELRELPRLVAKARSPLQSATELHQRFLEQESKGIRPEVAANAYANLGTLQSALQDFGMAENSYERSIAAYQEALASARQPALETQLLSVYGNLGALHLSALQPEKARSVLDRAVELQEELLRTAPAASTIGRRELARHHFNRGMVNTTENPDEAVEDFQRAIEIQRELAAASDALDEHLELAASRTQLGVARLNQAGASARAAPLLAAGKVRQWREQSRTTLTDVIRDLEAALDDQDDNLDLKLSLAVAQVELGRALAESGDLTAAEQRIGRAIELFDELAYNLPTADTRRKRALAYYSLGLAKSMSGGREAAAEAYRSSIAMQQQLVEDFPGRPVYALDLVKSLTNLAELQFKQGDPVAVAAIGRAVSHVQRAWKQLPDDRAARALSELSTSTFGPPILAATPSPTLRDFVYQTYYGAAQICIKNGAHAELAQIAESHVALWPESARDAYDAARLITLACQVASLDDKANPTKRERLVENYGRRGVEWIRRALEQGHRPEKSLKAEPDLKILRSRADFQELLAQFPDA